MYGDGFGYRYFRVVEFFGTRTKYTARDLFFFVESWYFSQVFLIPLYIPFYILLAIGMAMATTSAGGVCYKRSAFGHVSVDKNPGRHEILTMDLYRGGNLSSYKRATLSLMM